MTTLENLVKHLSDTAFANSMDTAFSGGGKTDLMRVTEFLCAEIDKLKAVDVAIKNSPTSWGDIR